MRLLRGGRRASVACVATLDYDLMSSSYQVLLVSSNLMTVALVDWRFGGGDMVDSWCRGGLECDSPRFRFNSRAFFHSSDAFHTSVLVFTVDAALPPPCSSQTVTSSRQPFPLLAVIFPAVIAATTTAVVAATTTASLPPPSRPPRCRLPRRLSPHLE